jgi:hypothetical protein
VQDFEKVLKQMIRRGIKERKAVKDPLSIECIDHVQFVKSKAAAFQGRGQFMEEIKTMLIGNGGRLVMSFNNI